MTEPGLATATSVTHPHHRNHHGHPTDEEKAQILAEVRQELGPVGGELDIVLKHAGEPEGLSDKCVRRPAVHAAVTVVQALATVLGVVPCGLRRVLLGVLTMLRAGHMVSACQRAEACVHRDVCLCARRGGWSRPATRCPSGLPLACMHVPTETFHIITAAPATNGNTTAAAEFHAPRPTNTPCRPVHCVPLLRRCLLRWVIASKWNGDHAVQRLKQHIEWRKQVTPTGRIDEVRGTLPPLLPTWCRRSLRSEPH